MKLKAILRIAKWEVQHQTSGIDKRTAVFVLLALSVTGAAFAVGGPSTQIQDDLYTVGVEEGPYEQAIKNSDSLVPLDPSTEKLYSGRTDLIIKSDGVVTKRFDDTQSDAALAVSESAVESYNRRILAQQDENVAAFPVLATVEYQEQSQQPSTEIGVQTQSDNTPTQSNTDDPTNPPEGQDSTTNPSSDGDDPTNPPEGQDSTTNPPSDGDDPTNPPEGQDSTTNPPSDGDTTTSPPDSDEPADQPSVPSPGSTESDTPGDTPSENQKSDNGETTAVQTPDGVTPPFPFEAVLLGFLFVIPMNFIVQTYSSSVIDERLDYSGELLLVSPVSRYDIILGKMLPYALILLGITTAIAVGVGASIVSVFAVMSFASAFLATGFLSGIFARSYKELTFVFLTLSILLISFALLPAIFTSVHPIAIISPLTVVVTELKGDQLPIAEIIFSTAPMLLTATLMIIYGAGIYQEEDLFDELPVPAKFFDMMGEQVNSWKSLLLIGASVLPFVFAAELLAIAVFFVVPEALSLPLILVVIAFIEEIGKSVGVYGGIRKGVLTTRRNKLLAAGVAGAGFFVAEKLTVIAQVVGLLELQLGNVTFGPVVTQLFPGPIGYLVPIFWIAIHPVTTMISTVGMKYGRRGYLAGLIVATLVHVLYNGVILYAA